MTMQERLGNRPVWRKVAGLTIAAVIAFALPLVVVALASSGGDGSPSTPTASGGAAEPRAADLGGPARPTTTGAGLAPLGTVGSGTVDERRSEVTARVTGSRTGGTAEGSGDSADAAAVPDASEGTSSTPPTDTTSSTAAPTTAASSAPSTTATTGATTTSVLGTTSTLVVPTTPLTRPPVVGGAGVVAEIGADCTTPGAIATTGDGRPIECRAIGNSGRARWRAL